MHIVIIMIIRGHKRITENVDAHITTIIAILAMMILFQKNVMTIEMLRFIMLVIEITLISV